MFAAPYSQSYYNPYQSYYDPYHLARYQARRRALELEQQRRAQAAAQRLCRVQYPAHEPFIDADDGYYTYQNPLQRAYTQRLRREALEQQHLTALRDEMARQEERRRQILVDQQRKQQSRCPPPSAQSPSPYPPEASSSPGTSLKRSSPSPPPKPEPAENPSAFPEKRAEAATKIQTAFRIHRALSALSAIGQQFESLRSSLTLPSTIDYETSSGVISIDLSSNNLASSSPLTEAPKLAFTPTNYNLHAYTEALSQLLIKLDTVESYGNASIRKTRRRIVGAVEAEASRVETFWKEAWAARLQNDAPLGRIIDEEIKVPVTTDAVTVPSDGCDAHKQTDDFVIVEEPPKVNDVGGQKLGHGVTRGGKDVDVGEVAASLDNLTPEAGGRMMDEPVSVGEEERQDSTVKKEEVLGNFAVTEPLTGMTWEEFDTPSSALLFLEVSSDGQPGAADDFVVVA